MMKMTSIGCAFRPTRKERAVVRRLKVRKIRYLTLRQVPGKKNPGTSGAKSGKDSVLESEGSSGSKETTEETEEDSLGLVQSETSEPNQAIENESAHKDLFGFSEDASQEISVNETTVGACNLAEEANSEILSASTADGRGRETGMGENTGTDTANGPKIWLNPVESIPRSPRNPSFGAFRAMDARKRSTETTVKNNPPATAAKGGGTGIKNCLSPPTVSENKGLKKVATRSKSISLKELSLSGRVGSGSS